MHKINIVRSKFFNEFDVVIYLFSSSSSSFIKVQCEIDMERQFA